MGSEFHQESCLLGLGFIFLNAHQKFSDIAHISFKGDLLTIERVAQISQLDEGPSNLLSKIMNARTGFMHYLGYCA